MRMTFFSPCGPRCAGNAGANSFVRMPAPYFFHSPADYGKWLPQHSFKVNTLKLAPKDATYPGPDGFATWLRITWIPYVQRLPESMREEFIAAVTRRYLAKHPRTPATACMCAWCGLKLMR